MSYKKEIMANARAPGRAAELSMRSRRLVLGVHVLDNADILREFLDWHLALGVDLILANDFGSTDGCQDILAEYARRRHVRWFFQPSKDTRDQDPSAKLTQLARDDYRAQWVLLIDTDEFVTVQGTTLESTMNRADREQVSVLELRPYNMTGPALQHNESALQHLTLKIIRPRHRLEVSPSDDLPEPFIFLGPYPPKTIVQASKFVQYAAGGHGARVSGGKEAAYPELSICHYPMRGYESFRTKVANAAAWFEANKHLEATPTWGWHWRRWIRLEAAGQLRQEYERQFVPGGRAQELIRDGVCAIDETIANWLKYSRHARREGIIARFLGSGARTT